MGTKQKTATKRAKDVTGQTQAAPATPEIDAEVRAERLAERRSRILERAGVRARREASLVPASESQEQPRTGDRFYDPDDFGAGNNASTEVADPDVGWLPLNGRPGR